MLFASHIYNLCSYIQLVETYIGLAYARPYICSFHQDSAHVPHLFVTNKDISAAVPDFHKQVRSR